MTERPRILAAWVKGAFERADISMDQNWVLEMLYIYNIHIILYYVQNRGDLVSRC